MRNDTPPRSPFISPEHNEDDNDLIYIEDADEILDEMDNTNEVSSEDEGAVGMENGDDESPDDKNQPKKDDAVITFQKHTGPVFCGAIHPSDNVAVTGGEDDKAYVWTIDTGAIVFEIKNHTDSVIAVEFSYDGNYLATGDMSGFIQIFKVHQAYRKVTEFQIGDMVWMKWHKAANVLLAGGDTGEVYIWRIPSSDCKVLQGNGQRSEVGMLMSDGKRIVIGYGDGTVKLWDIKGNNTIQEIPSDSTNGHSGAVTCVAVDPDNAIFLSGSEDGKIIIASASGMLGCLCPHREPIESLAYSTENEIKLLACGTLNGKVSLWDVAKQTIRVECDVVDTAGITNLVWTSNYTLLCSTLSGLIQSFDGRSGKLKFTLDGHTAEVYELSYSKSKNIILSVSEDCTAKIFNLFTL